MQLKHFDLDGDGQVTRDELTRALHADFDKYDGNHDGVLSVDEARALNETLPQRIPGASPVKDWNGDGHVDFNEYANQWLSLFERFDTNGDGIVTADEMSAGPMGPRGGEPAHRQGGGGRHPGGGHGGDH